MKCHHPWNKNCLLKFGIRETFGLFCLEMLWKIMKSTVNRIRWYARWIYEASEGVKGRLMTGTVLGIIRVGLGLVFILASKHMVDIATGVKEGNLWIGAAWLCALILGEIAISACNGYLYAQTDIRMKNVLRVRIFAHLLVSPLYKRGGFHSGDLTSRLEEDVRIVTSNLTNSFPTFVITLVQLLGAFGLMLKLDNRLALVLVVILPVFMLLGKLFTRKLRRMTSMIREKESKVQAMIQEGLQHSANMRAMECENRVVGRLWDEQSDLYTRTMKRTRFTMTSRSMLAFGFSGGYMIAFVWGCMQLHQEAITFGTMTAFLQLVGQIQRPTVEIAQLIPGFIHASTSIDRLAEMEKLEAEKKAGQIWMKGIPGIRLEHIGYSYPEEEKVIYRDFSYCFEPGSRTAILGQTGAGKTTLIRLMLALIKPVQGRMLLYDESGETEISPETRCNFAFVPQGNTLLSGTIRDNLRMGKFDATEEEMKKVLHVAAAEFVFTLPDGLDTLCGERGTGLSEGQAQRIAIARGLLRPGSVLLLDEISASLDKETEALLFERLAAFCTRKTIILITHRTEAAKYCTHILKL